MQIQSQCNKNNKNNENNKNNNNSTMMNKLANIYDIRISVGICSYLSNYYFKNKYQWYNI